MYKVTIGDPLSVFEHIFSSVTSASIGANIFSRNLILYFRKLQRIQKETKKKEIE